jgi:hypothetical protein
MDSKYETVVASPEMKENLIADEADEDEGEDDEDEDEVEIETFIYPDGYTKYVFKGM